MRLLLVEPGFLDFGLSPGAYVAQQLATGFTAAGHDVLGLASYSTRVAKAGSIHRSRVDGIPVVVIGAGPPGYPAKSRPAVRTAVHHLARAYSADVIVCSSHRAPLTADLLAEAFPDVPLLTCDVAADGSLGIRFNDGEHVYEGPFPMPEVVPAEHRLAGSPRFAVLPAHTPDPAGWLPLRKGLSDLSRSDYELLVAADGSDDVLGHWPSAGLVRSLPLRGIGSLTALFDAVDVLLWPAGTGESVDPVMVHAALQGVPLVVVGDDPATAAGGAWVSDHVPSDPASLSALIVDVKAGLLKPVTTQNWPSASDVCRRLRRRVTDHHAEE